MNIIEIDEQEVFAISDEVSVEIKIVGDHKVAVIDNIYKNPEMVRDLSLSIPPTDSLFNIGGLAGKRVHSFYDMTSLAYIFHDVSKHMFDYAKDWTYESAVECMFNVPFMVNIMNNDMIVPRSPHHDSEWDTIEKTVLDNPKEMVYNANGIAGLIYLNTPEECSGGTAFYSYDGTQDPLPKDWHDETITEFMTDDHEKWKMLEMIEMKWNRLLIYPNYIFHSAYYKKNMGFENDNYRLNQVMFL